MPNCSTIKSPSPGPGKDIQNSVMHRYHRRSARHATTGSDTFPTASETCPTGNQDSPGKSAPESLSQRHWPLAGCATATAKTFGSRSLAGRWGRSPTQVALGNAAGRLPGGKPDEGELRSPAFPGQGISGFLTPCGSFRTIRTQPRWVSYTPRPSEAESDYSVAQCTEQCQFARAHELDTTSGSPAHSSTCR